MEAQEMFNPMDHPVFLLLFSLPVFWFSSWLGASFRKRQRDIQESTRSDLTFVLGGAMTLLGLIIGFTYSMAVTRYDQRKNYEEEEANAIGTESVRADYLPSAEAAKIRALLKNYLCQRILYYEAGQGEKLSEINGQTTRLQVEMWNEIVPPTSASPTQVGALVVSGMNNVLNSQGYTQAAWWNRIPIAAWILVVLISVFCNLLIGYSVHEHSNYLLLILPAALSIALFLIADIDSPRGGTIHVHPQNLESLARSLDSQ
jgi:ABC-type branched-subunit amino acid transport system permease subunit